MGVVKFSISDPETESSSSIFPMLVASGCFSGYLDSHDESTYIVVNLSRWTFVYVCRNYVTQETNWCIQAHVCVVMER